MTEQEPFKILPSQGTWTRLIRDDSPMGSGPSAPETKGGGRPVRVWKPGDLIIGVYEVERVVSGGMGHVYIAYHRKWHRKVAVKSPNEKMLAHKRLFSRILREAGAWVAMGLHPNIAYCHHVRSIDHVPHIVVEYIDGGNLRSWLKQPNRNDFREALNLAIQFCHGMEFAHAKGMIHRDIKPENILLTRNGILKITDFGLVRTGPPSADSGSDGNGFPEIHEPDLTLAGASMGTPHYMSPEQRENPHEVDERADIFSFGVCLYEMVCGVRPDLKPCEPPPDPSRMTAKPGFPRSLSELMIRCVNHRREDRWRNFTELRIALCAFFRDHHGEDSPFADMELLPPEADGCNNQGVSLLELERFDEARSAFENALRHDGLHPQANWNLGRFQTLNRSLFHPAHQESTIDMVRAALKESGFPEEAVEERLRRALDTGDFFLTITLPLSGHTGRVNAVAFSPCGRYIATGGSDQTVILWNPDSGVMVKQIPGCGSGVASIAFSSDGNRLAVSSDRWIRVFDAGGERMIYTLSGHTLRVSAITASPDGLRLASAGDDGLVKIWDLSRGKCVRTLEEYHPHAVSAVAFSRDGRFLAAGGDDRCVRIWNTEDGALHACLKDHADGVSSVAFSPDGRTLASGSRDQTIRLWNANIGATSTPLYGHKHWVNGLTFSPDGQFLVTASGDHTLRIWSGKDGHPIKTLEGHRREVSAAAFSPDGRRLASAGRDRTVKIWDAEVLNPQLTAPRDYFFIKKRLHEKKLKVKGLEADIRRSYFSKAYQGVLNAWSNDGFGRESPFYPLFRRLRSSGRPRGIRAIHPFLKLSAQTEAIGSLAFSRAGDVLAITGGQGDIHIRAPETGHLVSSLRGDGRPVRSIAFSPDGRVLATASGSVILWDTGTWKQRHALPHPKRVAALAFSSVGEILVTAGEGRSIRLWDIGAGRVIRSIETPDADTHSLSASPDGQWIASAGGTFVRIWDARTGEPVRTMAGHRLFMNVLAFSPDGKYLAATDCDNAVRLWDTETGAENDRLTGARADILCIAFSPDGRYLAAGTGGQTVDIWEIGESRPMKILEGHRGPVAAVACSSDGRFIASGGHDAEVRIWLVVPDLHFDQDLLPAVFSENHQIAHLEHLISRKKYREAFQKLREAWIREEFSEKSAVYRVYQELLTKGRNAGEYAAVLAAALRGHTSYVTAVDFSPDGTLLASGSWDTRVRLWDMRNGSPLSVLSGHSGQVTSVRFCPGGSRLASGGSDGAILLRDITGRQAAQRLAGHAGKVSSLVFLRKGDILVSAGDDNAIRFWDTGTGRMVKHLAGEAVRVNTMAFSPHRYAFAVGGDDTRVRMIRLKGGRSIRHFKGNAKAVAAVAFSSDGGLLASAGEDGTVRVWDVETGRMIHIFRDHTAEAVSVSFSPDGLFIVSGGEDHTVRLRDLHTGALLQTLEGHLKRVSSVAFSPDSRLIASGSEDNTIRLWLIMPKLIFD